MPCQPRYSNPRPLPPQAPEAGLCSCPRKVGQEGDREQDGDFSRGCWENAWLPDLVLERKKGSKAASPAQQFVPSRAWGPGQSCALPPAPGAQTKEAVEDQEVQGWEIPGPPGSTLLFHHPKVSLGREGTESENRVCPWTSPSSWGKGLWRPALVFFDVTKYYLQGNKLGVSSRQPSYLLKGPFLGNRVVHPGGDSFKARPGLLCLGPSPSARPS